MTAMEALYVMHVCKNASRQQPTGRIINVKGMLVPEQESVCDNAWLDIDRHGAKDYPPSWRFCATCSAKGFKPEPVDPAKKLRMAELRKLAAEKRALEKAKLEEKP